MNTPAGGLSRNAADETVLQEHIARTFPTALDGWLAKEHLWSLGDRLGIERKIAGQLFMELRFPIKEKPARFAEAKVIDPATLGLNISTRHEVGLGYPPVVIVTTAASRRAWAHLDRTNKGWPDMQPVVDAVIQAESIVDFATHREQHGKALFTRSALGALTVFSAELLELPFSSSEAAG